MPGILGQNTKSAKKIVAKSTTVPPHTHVEDDITDLVHPAGGDMLIATYDPTAVSDDAFDMDNMVEGATTKILSDTERTIIGNQSNTNTGDMSNANVKTAYEANADTNEFSDSEQTKLANLAGTNTGDEPDASLTVKGIVELATIAEVNTGTDAIRAVTPDSLEGSALQIKVDGIEALAEVNVIESLSEDPTPTLSGDLVTDGNHIVFDAGTLSGFLDEDDMVTDSNASAASQQSIKAFVEALVAQYLALAGGTITGDILVEAELLVEDRLSCGDTFVDGLATRALNLIASNATMRVYRISAGPNDDAGIELLTADNNSELNKKQWDIYLDKTDDSLHFRRRTGGDLNVLDMATGGVITFPFFPITPSSAPTTDYQVANKKYVGDSIAAIGTPISNVVEDITPQLGGDLDMNGKNIDFPSVANISDVKDEDNMSSNSATMLATQQSIKAYADLKAAIGGAHHDGFSDYVSAEHYDWSQSLGGMVLVHNDNINGVSATFSILDGNQMTSHDFVFTNGVLTSYETS